MFFGLGSKILSLPKRLNPQFRGIDVGAFIALIIKFLAIALAYLQNIILAHCMLPEAFGEYAMGLSIAMALGVTIAAGQPTAILRFWPQYVGQGESALARGSLAFGYLVVAISALSFGVFAATTLFYIPVFSTLSFLIYAVPLTVAWAFSEFLMGALRAKGSVVGAIFPRDVILRIVIISIGLFSLFKGIGPLSSNAILTISSIVLFAIVIAQIFYSLKLSARESRSEGIRLDLKLWSSTSAGIWMATTLGMLQSQVDTPAVGLFLTSTDAGHFFAVQRTASLLTVALLATTTVAAPVFSGLYHRRLMPELQKKAALFALSVSTISLLIFLIYIFFGKFVLNLFGASFASLTLELNILSTGYLVDALCGPAGVLLLLSGHEQLHLRVVFVTLLLKIALQFIAIPAFGLMGAVVVSAFCQALVPIVLCILIFRKIGIDASILGGLKYIAGRI